ncbi:MAG: hypothetical protein R3E12_03825 [Candidatus Eisenbacteria bacterium]
MPRRSVSFEPSALRFASALALLTLATSFSMAAPPESVPDPQTDLDRNTRVDVNQLDMFVTNHGSFAYNIPDGVSGLVFPRGTDNGVIFAGGLWVGAMVDDAVRATLAEYSFEYQPGQIVSPMEWTDPNDRAYRVYKIAPGDTPASNPDYADLARRSGGSGR